MRAFPIAVLLASAVVAGPAVAHHSFAMFDATQRMTLQGTVKALNWTNPHVTLMVQGGPAGGKPELWTLELTSPGNLTRLGWTKRSLTAGQAVQVEMNPLRDGRKGGAFRKVTILSTGEVLTASLIDQVKPK
jgi:hypothetical protein